MYERMQFSLYITLRSAFISPFCSQTSISPESGASLLSPRLVIAVARDESPPAASRVQERRAPAAAPIRADFSRPAAACPAPQRPAAGPTRKHAPPRPDALFSRDRARKITVIAARRQIYQIEPEWWHESNKGAEKAAESLRS